MITNAPGNPSKTRNNHNPIEILASFVEGEDWKEKRKEKGSDIYNLYRKTMLTNSFSKQIPGS